jgi:hypothetical protein
MYRPFFIPGLQCFPGVLQSLLHSISKNFHENLHTDNKYSVFSLLSKAYVILFIYLLGFSPTPKFYCHAGMSCGYTGAWQPSDKQLTNHDPVTF